MKIGILQTGLTPDTMVDRFGQYGAQFERLLDGRGFTFQTFSVVEGVFPSGPDAADGWLITGSKHGAYEDHAWIPPLEELIRGIYAAERPMIGVCFGHQIIAQAMGGTVEKFADGWAVGPQTYQFSDAIRTVQAWHQDQVIAVPDDAEVVASNDFCANAALLYPGRAYTVQAHPEFDDAFVQGLMTERAPGVVPSDTLEQAKDRMGISLQRMEVADQFERFFKERRLA